jgi:hypothetical protein
VKAKTQDQPEEKCKVKANQNQLEDDCKVEANQDQP